MSPLRRQRPPSWGRTVPRSGARSARNQVIEATLTLAGAGSAMLIKGGFAPIWPGLCVRGCLCAVNSLLPLGPDGDASVLIEVKAVTCGDGHHLVCRNDAKNSFRLCAATRLSRGSDLAAMWLAVFPGYVSSKPPGACWREVSQPTSLRCPAAVAGRTVRRRTPGSKTRALAFRRGLGRRSGNRAKRRRRLLPRDDIPRRPSLADATPGLARRQPSSP